MKTFGLFLIFLGAYMFFFLTVQFAACSDGHGDLIPSCLGFFSHPYISAFVAAPLVSIFGAIILSEEL